MRRRLAAALSPIALLLAAAAHGGDEAALDADQPYRAERSNPVAYDVDFSVVVTAPFHTKLLRVWLPLPQSDVGQEVGETELSSFPIEVTPQIAAEPTFGNRFAYFEFDHPEGAQIIRHRFRVTVWELRWNLDPERVQPVAAWPSAFEPYLRSEQAAVVVDERFQTLAADIVPQRRGPARDLAATMQWVREHMRYDHAAASLQASSEHALETGAGHCSDYHGFCAALGRALGFPTRVTYGINPFPKNSPSHCKLEAYLPPYGWVSFDVSETQRLIAAIDESELRSEEKARLTAAAVARLTSGFRDNTWFLQTRGTDYDLAPPAGRRASVVRTAYVEADGEPLPDPDPANAQQREFGWMTVHRYRPDREVAYPFRDWRTLEGEGK